MRTLAMTAILGLAWFAAANILASAISMVWASRLPETTGPDRKRARVLLAVRFLPFVSAALLSLGVFLPAHIDLEPPGADERFGMVVLALAAMGGFVLLYSAWNIARTAFASMRLAALARTSGRTTGIGRMELPGFGGIVLAGVWRPRVIVGSRARGVLTKAELDMAIRHELAHHAAQDNLIRVLMFAVPDLLGPTGAGRRVRRLWEEQAECMADARAAGGDPVRAATLASALLKVARVSGTPPRPLSPAWSAFHHPALLERRIRLLLTPPAQAEGSALFRLWPLGFAVLATSLWLTDLPVRLHRVTELLIASLP
jgi:hypothetical protein